jgi:hypothetical protein
MPITHTTWAKGQSGNPGGRPRIIEAVRDIARESTTLAIETLRTIAADTDAPHAARVSAASALLDRGWGKPLQGVAMMTVAAPRGVREMSDGELLAMIETKTGLGA